MTPHSLKMLMLFIVLVAVINSLYYAVYLTYDPGLRRMNRQKGFRTNDYGRQLRIPIVKVVWLPGPNGTRIRQTLRVFWVPEYSYAKIKTTMKTSTVTTSQTDYRDSDDYSYTELKKGGTCPPVPLLIGPTDWISGIDPIVMERVFSLLEPGGVYKPFECVTSHTVAVIVPYKGTNGPLLLFLFTLHIAMLKQQVEYQVFVVREFDESRPLNSGKFFNIGFFEAHKVKPHRNWTCFVFHDPYLAPADARNLYRCSEHPKQLVGKIDKILYDNKFGGVIAMRPEDFRTVNGFSNLYKDGTVSIYHDMYDRLIAANFTIEKPSAYGIYNNLGEVVDYTDSSGMTTTTTTLYPTIPELTSTITVPQSDGLSTLSYTVNTELRITHTLVTVGTRNKKHVPSKLMSALIRIPTYLSFSTLTTTEYSSSSTTITKKITNVTVKRTHSKHKQQLKKRDIKNNQG